MSVQKAETRLRFPPIAKALKLYRQLSEGIYDCEQVGNRLIHYAEQARAFRQQEALSQLALILSGFPLERHRIVGQYYMGLALYRSGLDHLEQATALFEKVVSVGTPKYKAEALISLSAVAWRNQKPDEMFRCFLEASKVGDFATSLQAFRGIGALKGQEGFHHSAVRDFEKHYPLIKHAPPLIHFDYLNSYAVELGIAGRKQEARAICKRVLASPFAYAYPEWQETADEVRGCSKSFVTVGVTPHRASNVLRLPVSERAHQNHSSELYRKNQPADIFSLQDWKEKMPKQSNGYLQCEKASRPVTSEQKQARLMELKKLTTKQKLLRLYDLIGDVSTSDEQLLKALLALEDIEPDETSDKQLS